MLAVSHLIFVNVRKALITFDHVGWLHCRLTCKSTLLSYMYSCFCIYSNWNYSNLRVRQCFNDKVWFHFAFVFNGN